MTSARLHDAVERALRERWPSADLGALESMDGGRSGVTLVAELRGTGTGPQSIVVKAAPEGRPAVGRHDMARQARALIAVAAVPGVVVPEVLATGTEPTAFVAMTRCPGEAVEPVLDAASVHLEADLVRARALAAAAMLAALHRAPDISASPGQTEEPVADLEDELRRWLATAEAADTAILVDGIKLARLLEKSMPERMLPPVLVHGDYRLGNIVFDGPRPTGLIDWEIWGRTDPGIDIGWFLAFCDADLFPGIGIPVAGLPSAGELLECYLAAGGQPISQTAWYEAFGRFKMAAIMAHNLRRHREGRHHDSFQERLPPTIAMMVATGIEKLSEDG